MLAMKFGAITAVVSLVIMTLPLTGASSGAKKRVEAEPPIYFPYGAATTSEFCGVCHQAIYQEHAYGVGADLNWQDMVLKSMDETPMLLPPDTPRTTTAHHAAGVDPWPIRAREAENGGKSCNTCHFPEAFDLPDINTPVMTEPVPRSVSRESVGVTCASCHMRPDGKIRGSYGTRAPHETVADPNMRTSAACAYCHSKGPRVVGKQTQTFYEWRDDFANARLGTQQCQDCHMPRTTRSLAEIYDVPTRVVGRHLWTGDHSTQRTGQGLSVTLQQIAGTDLVLHVVNIAAGHSVPTGSNRRAIYLIGELLDASGAVAASTEWMFAPWYGNRPDDKSYLDQDKSLPDAIAAMQADAQGPHEPPVRAGEDRVLRWSPNISTGTYTFRATLVYDLNRYNDRAFRDDQTQIYQTSIAVQVP